MIVHEKELLAYLAGQEVEFKSNYISDKWISFCDVNYSLGIFNSKNYDVRLKPQTIAVTFQMPKTFIPNLSEEYWYLDSKFLGGVDCANYTACGRDLRCIENGVWKTKNEALQVVEALNSFRKQGLK